MMTQLELSREAAEAGRMRWPIRPKHHYMEHMVEQAYKHLRNPKLWGCMLDEDFLGQVVRLGKVVNRMTVHDHIIWRFQLRLSRRTACHVRKAAMQCGWIVPCALPAAPAAKAPARPSAQRAVPKPARQAVTLPRKPPAATVQHVLAQRQFEPCLPPSLHVAGCAQLGPCAAGALQGHLRRPWKEFGV